MKLEMRDQTESAQDLPANDNEMTTGEMGACVSVIVLWNRVGNNYQDVRGHHGAGGIEQVNFASLLNGVPNDQGTQIYVISGDDNRSQQARRTIAEAVRLNILRQLPQALIRTYQMIANASVNRQGHVNILSARV